MNRKQIADIIDRKSNTNVMSTMSDCNKRII